MDNKWTCPKCGAENGEKNIRDGKFICWKCDYVSADRPGKPDEVFTPKTRIREPSTLKPGEVFKPKAGETPVTEPGGTSTTKPGEVFPGPDTPPHDHDRGGTHPVTPVEEGGKRPGCMAWLAGLVAVLVLVGVAINLLPPPPPPDDGETSEIIDGSGGGSVLTTGLRYVDGVEVSLYAPLDGYKPESMARKGSVVYFTQDGGLYFLKNGEVSQINLDGWEAEKVRVRNDEEVLVLTRPKEEDGAYRYTILRVLANSYTEDNFLSEHFTTEYREATGDVDMYPTDFAVSPSGATLWLVIRHLPDDDTRYMNDTEYTLDCCYHRTDSGRYETETLETKAVFEYMVPNTNMPYMLFDQDGNLYITGPEDGFIRILRENETVPVTFAGQTTDLPGSSGAAVIGVRGWNDFGTVTFLYPTALTLAGQYLYVVDEGTVRRIPLAGVPDDGIYTMAGNITDEAQAVSAGATVSGEDALLETNSRSGLITLDDDGNTLLLSAPGTGVVYAISTKEG